MSATSAAALRQQAIAWLVESRSGAMTEHQRKALDRWRQADPAHEAAWSQVIGSLERVLQPLAPHTSSHASADAALNALLQPDRRRRRIAGGALAFAGAALGGLVAHRFTPLPGLLADAHTATAERRSLELADGSRLLLDARSAIDIDLGADSRRVHLRQGALIAQVPAGSPFTVQTRHGQAQVPAAHGARFMVRLQEERTQVAALAQDVVLHTRLGAQSPLQAGASAWMDGVAISEALARAEAAAAWQSGMLAVDDWPLDSVVDALRPYRTGLLRVAPAASRLRVLGTFPLDNTDRALQALASSLPIRVTRYRGGWLTLIDAA